MGKNAAVELQSTGDSEMMSFNALLKGDGSNRSQGDFHQLFERKMKVTEQQIDSLDVIEVNGHFPCNRVSWEHVAGWSPLTEGTPIAFKECLDAVMAVCVTENIPLRCVRVTSRGPHWRFHVCGEDIVEEGGEAGHFRGGVGYRVLWPIAAGPSFAVRCLEGATLHALRVAPFVKLTNTASSFGGECCPRTSARLCFIYICSLTFVTNCSCPPCEAFQKAINDACEHDDGHAEEEEEPKMKKR